MASFDESSFRFAFGGSWVHVVRWDESIEYRHGIQRVQGELDDHREGTKAADFIAVRDGALWMFEVKDFRNRLADWQERRRTLALEVALKVRDTLAGVVALHRQDGAASWSRDAVRCLASTTAPTVVAVIAKPAEVRESLPSRKLGTHEAELRKRSAGMLRWLTRKVLLVDPAVSNEVERVPDLAVSALPQ